VRGGHDGSGHRCPAAVGPAAPTGGRGRPIARSEDLLRRGVGRRRRRGVAGMTSTLTTIAQIPDLVRRQKQANVDLIKGYENLSATLLVGLTAAAAKENLRVVLDYYVDDGSPDVVAYGISGFA